jgi:hypothetical protein
MANFELRFVSFWRSWYKLWSVQLAGVAGLIATAILGNQSLALSLIDELPKGTMRWVVAALIGFVVFFLVPTLTVLLKQPKLNQ